MTGFLCVLLWNIRGGVCKGISSRSKYYFYELTEINMTPLLSTGIKTYHGSAFSDTNTKTYVLQGLPRGSVMHVLG
jgi:hypothetical protein